MAQSFLTKAFFTEREKFGTNMGNYVVRQRGNVGSGDDCLLSNIFYGGD